MRKAIVMCASLQSLHEPSVPISRTEQIVTHPPSLCLEKCPSISSHSSIHIERIRWPKLHCRQVLASDQRSSMDERTIQIPPQMLIGCFVPGLAFSSRLQN